MKSARYFVPAILLFSLLLFFPALGARDLWGPVEPRYAEIARVLKIGVIERVMENAALRSGNQEIYLRIRSRALEKLPDIAAETVIATTTLGNTTWYLLARGR